MLLLAVSALGAWALPVVWQPPAMVAGWLWGTAILVFLAGAERGLSFRPDDSSEPRQVVSALALFTLAFGSLLSPPPIAFTMLACGYGGLAIVDRAASRRGLAPPHFAALRPVQALVAVPALLALLARSATAG